MIRRRQGNTIIEAAMFIPILTLLLVGMIQIGKITFVYHTLRKTLYSAARYMTTQQGANFCDGADAVVTAAKNFALRGTTDDSAELIIPNLTADMVQIRVERYNPDTQELGECDCSASGCDIASGGRQPDFVVVSIPDGYEVRPRIPFLSLDPIPLKPEVRLPFGGT